MSVTSKSALNPSGEVLTFDTEFWGVKIGRAHSVDIDQWAKENMVGSVCLLIDSDEPERVQKAEEHGFRFMDIRVTYGRDTAPTESANVREYLPDDVERLVEIARESHRITRFYADPRFSNERCDDLYETWIRSSCSGWADTVFVSGDAAGYCTVHTKGLSGSIGLIAVDERERGYGHGTELVRASVNWCYQQGLTKITVVTQGRNIPAQRLFERCDFLVEKTELWFHKWMNYDA